MWRLLWVAISAILLAICGNHSTALIYFPTDPTATTTTTTAASPEPAENDTDTSTDTSEDTSTERPRAEDWWTQLDQWHIQKEGRVDVNPEIFNNCSITTRCIGIPGDCLQKGTCTTFVEIKLAEDTKTFLFRMYILLAEERAHETPRYWVALGLNKVAQRMGSANVMMCYFKNDAAGVPADGVFYGWTNGQKGVIPVDEDSKMRDAHHLTNIRMVRENRNTLFKCFFERQVETEIVINKVEYPEIAAAAAVDEHSMIFSLKDNSVYLIMAWGELDPEVVEPKFKAHHPSQSFSSDKTTLAFSRCTSSMCFGIGPDGCEHATNVPCDMSLEVGVEYVRRNGKATPEIGIWIKAMKIEGFVALALSKTTKSEEAISKLMYLLSCNKKKNFAWKFHALANCSRDPSSETLVVCNAMEFIEQMNPFAPRVIDGQRMTAGHPGFDGVACGETFPFGKVMAFRYQGFRYYLYLLSSNKSDFEDEEGKIRLHITETPSLTSIRSKSPTFFPEKYSDFYVLSSEAGHNKKRTLGTAGDPNFGESSCSGERTAIKVDSIRGVLVTFRFLASFPIITFFYFQ